MTRTAAGTGACWTISDGRDIESPFDASVVVATILRPTLLQSVRSIFAQDLGGRIQILIGIDKPKGDRGMIDRLQAECPSHCAITLCEPGYSTAALNGGTYSAITGGGLLSALSTLSNSRYVCYLDDDNWYAPDHLSSLRAIMDSDVGWVHSWRWFVNAFDDRCIDVDRWHAAGPDAGLYASTMRGLVDTNCYMIDKARCWDMLWRWSHALQKKGAGNDRGVFRSLLRKEPWRSSEKPTVYYRLPPEREWVVHHWKWKGIEPKADKRRTTFRSIAGAIDNALPMPRLSEESAEDRPAIHPVLRDVIALGKPRDVVDLWAGGGDRTIQLGLAAREAERPLRVLAVDTWLPVPVTSRGELQPLAEPLGQYLAFCRRVAASDLRQAVTALPQSPYDAAHLLRRTNTQLDVVMMAGDRGDPESLLRAWWPMLRPGGLALVDPGSQGLGQVEQQLGGFAAARAARIGPVGKHDQRMIAIRRQPRQVPPVRETAA